MVNRGNIRKSYLTILKNEILDFQTNFKKRVKRFPWNKISKLPKNKLYSSTVVSVHGAKFTMFSLIKELTKIKKTLELKIKNGAFNVYLRSYLKDSSKVKQDFVKNIYKTYSNELKREFKACYDNLAFCTEALIQINKSLKSKDIDIKESYMSDLDIELNEELEEIIKEVESKYNIEDDSFLQLNNNIIESEEYKMSKIEYVELMLESSIHMNEIETEMEITEGANLNSRAYFKKAKKEYKRLIKIGKIQLKNEEYSKAKKTFTDCLKMLKEFHKFIDNEVSSTGSVVFAWLIADGWLTLGRDFLTCLIPIVGVPIASIRNFIEEIDGIVKTWQKTEDIKECLNFYKNRISVFMTKMEDKCKNLINKIDSMERLSDDSEKEIKEAKLALYEACEAGTLTIEERNELLDEIEAMEACDTERCGTEKCGTERCGREACGSERCGSERCGGEACGKETCVGPYCNDKIISPAKKFEYVKAELYRKCNNGEISEDRREELIRRAHEMLLEEASDMNNIVKDATKDMDKESKKMEKEAEKSMNDNNSGNNNNSDM